MIAISKYGSERAMMCNYEEDQMNYGFDSTSPSSASTISSLSSGGSSSDNGPIFVFPPTADSVDMKMPQLRKSVNKLGGMYTSGKPLNLATRREIVAMSETGMKACDISRQLQISHGCVSKIISKWRVTGSFEPRRIGGSKPKKTLPEVIAAVRMYKRACPSIHSLEIRRRLLADEICTDYNVPSLSSINRIIRMKLRDEVAEFEASAVRDLMAILTGPGCNSDDTDCEMSPEPPNNNKHNKEMKLENVADEGEEEFDETPPPQSYPTAAPPSSVQQIEVEEPPVCNNNFQEKMPVCNNNNNDLSNTFPEFKNAFDYSLQQWFQTSTPPTMIKGGDKKSTVNQRGQDLFSDPYGDRSLGTPVFNESSNLESNSPSSSSFEPRFRAFDNINSGLVFSFDFEENVWSWLDQVP